MKKILLSLILVGFLATGVAYAQSSTNSNSVTVEQIIAYLQSHPDFWQQFLALLKQNTSNNQTQVTTSEATNRAKLKIVSPKSGDVWRNNTESQVITWKYDGGANGADRVQIDLEGTHYGLASGQRLDLGRVMINVPTDITPGQYRIKITDLDNPRIFTFGDYFTIASPNVPAPAQLRITLPTGGETWQIGSTKEIGWTDPNYNYASGVQYYVYATTQGGSWYGKISSTGENSINWQVGKIMVGNELRTLEPGRYWITVVKDDGVAVRAQGISAGWVELTPGTNPEPNPSAQIKVLSPNGGEVWARESMQKIKWNRFSNGGTVNISFAPLWADPCLGLPTGQPCPPVIPGEPFWIAKGVADSGLFDWKVGDILAFSNGNPRTFSDGQYVITICSAGTALNQTCDSSDSQFTITSTSQPPQPSTISIRSPRAGETWKLGEQRNIEWQDGGTNGTYKIFVGSSADGVERLIGQTTERRFRWTVGQIGTYTMPPADYYYVRVMKNDVYEQSVKSSIFNVVASNHAYLSGSNQTASASDSLGSWLYGMFPNLFSY